MPRTRRCFDNSFDTHLLLSTIRSQTPTFVRQRYALQLAPVNPLVDTELKLRKVKVIPITPGHSATASIAEWLTGFRNRVRRASVRSNLPPAGEIVGRQSDVERIVEALASRAPVVAIEGFAGIGKNSARPARCASDCRRGRQL